MATDSERFSGDLQRARPIFVLGISQRCGTNFLVNLLCSHPHCALPAPVWEDFLVAHSDHLTSYVDNVSQRWDPQWGNIDSLRDQLNASIGYGLTSFLDERCNSERTVTKTPSVENLEHFFEFFPDADLVILVRDGRAVVESGIRSFGWDREWAIDRWATAADRVLEFDRKYRHSGARYKIVRYEDLYEDLEGELRDVFDSVGLDADLYDFKAATQLPVRGSSAIREQGADVHWEPVAKSQKFDPLSRFSDWTRGQHERFNRVAGHQLEQLGYSPQRASSGRAVWAVWSTMLDIGWKARRLLSRTDAKVRRRIGRPQATTPGRHKAAGSS